MRRAGNQAATGPHPSGHEVRRANRGPILVVWERRDGFDAEDEPPVPFTWNWSSPNAHAIDAFGTEVPAEVLDGQLQLAISVTPCDR